jgi:hypothetical protein
MTDDDIFMDFIDGKPVQESLLANREQLKKTIEMYETVRENGCIRLRTGTPGLADLLFGGR